MTPSASGHHAWVTHGPPTRPGAPGTTTPPSGGALPDPERRAELADVRRLARRGLRVALRAARADETPTPRRLIHEHLGPAAADGEIIQETWPSYEAVNVQVALDAWLAEPERAHALFGVHSFHDDGGLAGLLDPQNLADTRVGNVSKTNQACGPLGRTYPCVDRGLWLVDGATGRLAVSLRAAAPHFGRPRVSLEVLAGDPDVAERTVADIRRLTQERNVFRGQVLSFGEDMFGAGESALAFHERPRVRREDLILADGVLPAIERQVVGIARHREALLAAGQHLKRGLLLYGPPGVGKTHTIRYLISTLVDVTVIQVSGEALGVIDQACSVARALQPSIVVVEDVDLIAEDRGIHPGQHPLLFQLLNEMDGLEGDADVAFVLTTNRADLLEPALAARPGRVDEAVAIDLPDLAARRRLFDLYRGSLDVRADDAAIDEILRRADGITASFLKELLRRAALTAAERGETGGAGKAGGPDEHDEHDEHGLVVRHDDLTDAMDHLLGAHGRMTRILLGSGTDADRFEGSAPPGFYDWGDDAGGDMLS